MSDIISVAEHKKRVRFRLRLQFVAFGAALVGLICFGIVLQANVQSAVLGGIGLAGLGVAIIFYVWSLIYGFMIAAKRPSPPNLR